MTYNTLISTQDLATHLDGTWAIVDCRHDLQNDGWGIDEYRRAHIPGAAYASLSRDLAAPASGAGGRHPLPEPRTLDATFSRLGISNGRQVVAYDQETGMFASRLWWLLRYMGHEAAAVLDGGWTKWLREGRPTRGGEEAIARGMFTGQPREEMRLTVEDVAAKVAGGSALLVDARSPDRFEGRDEPIDRVPGHIPGAVNHYYKQNMTPAGEMLPSDRLREQFAGVLGDRPPDQAIMYCGSGVSACQNLLALEHAGITGVRLYVGSWSEWSSDPKRPVQTGPAMVTRKPS
jgi:thiosulfate/3-mercaptopyruvate sulfurtransferase